MISLSRPLKSVLGNQGENNLSKLIETIVKTIGALVILLFIFFVLQLVTFFQKTEYCYCVVVFQESDFTGEWLKHKNSVLSSRIKTEECVSLDNDIDNGDSNKKGKVRWVECPSGPDCDELGQF